MWDRLQLDDPLEVFPVPSPWDIFVVLDEWLFGDGAHSGYVYLCLETFQKLREKSRDRMELYSDVSLLKQGRMATLRPPATLSGRTWLEGRNICVHRDVRAGHVYFSPGIIPPRDTIPQFLALDLGPPIDRRQS